MSDDQRSNADLEPTDQGDREVELKIRAWGGVGKERVTGRHSGRAASEDVHPFG